MNGTNIIGWIIVALSFGALLYFLPRLIFAACLERREKSR